MKTVLLEQPGLLRLAHTAPPGAPGAGQRRRGEYCLLDHDARLPQGTDASDQNWLPRLCGQGRGPGKRAGLMGKCATEGTRDPGHAQEARIRHHPRRWGMMATP